MKLLLNLSFCVFFLNTALIPKTRAADVIVAYGSAAYHGDLSTEQVAPISSVQIKSSTDDSDQFGSSIRSFVGFEVVQSRTRHNGHFFPYGTNAHLSLLGFFVVPGVCLNSLVPLKLCGHVGIGTLNVNSMDNRQDYGTWNYQLDGNYRLGGQYFIRLALKKIGDVEQTVDERSSHFWLTAALLAIGRNY